jgi:hypothetical protein
VYICPGMNVYLPVVFRKWIASVEVMSSCGWPSQMTKNRHSACSGKLNGCIQPHLMHVIDRQRELFKQDIARPNTVRVLPWTEQHQCASMAFQIVGLESHWTHMRTAGETCTPATTSTSDPRSTQTNVATIRFCFSIQKATLHFIQACDWLYRGCIILFFFFFFLNFVFIFILFSSFFFLQLNTTRITFTAIYGTVYILVRQLTW